MTALLWILVVALSLLGCWVLMERHDVEVWRLRRKSAEDVYERITGRSLWLDEELLAGSPRLGCRCSPSSCECGVRSVLTAERAALERVIAERRMSQ